MSQNADVDRDRVLAQLRAHEPELRAAGIVRLRLHGSVARGEQLQESDVDLIADFDVRKRLSLLDLVEIENRLTELLGVRVDLSLGKTLKPPVRERADREAILAF